MSLLKGIFVYTLIFLGLIVGIGIILIGVMFFFPEVSVFGYKFYHGSNGGHIYNVVASPDGVDKRDKNIIYLNSEILNSVDAVEIDTNVWDITVVLYDAKGVKNASFRVDFTPSITGFVSAKNPNPDFSVKAEKRAITGSDEIKNVMTFSTLEPKGAYFSRDAHLNVWIPNTINTNGAIEDFIINSGNGMINVVQLPLVSLGEVGNPELNIQNLHINDESDFVSIQHLNITNSLNIDSHKSKFSIDRDINCDVNLKADKGKFAFKNVGGNSNISISAGNADIQFGDIEGNVSINSDYGYFRANEIDGDFSALSHATEEINNACDFKIKSILGSVIFQNDSGNIEIGQVGKIDSVATTDDLVIDTNSGDVTIMDCFAKSIKINSTSGVIGLGNCLGKMNINSQNGSVYVGYMTKEFTRDGISKALIEAQVDKLDKVSTIINTGVKKGNGAIEVLNSRGTLQLDSNGRGKINATIDNLPNASQNKINAHDGNVSIVINDKLQYWLNWKANKSSDIHLVDFKTSAKSMSADMQNFDKDANAVFIGGDMDKSVSTKMTVLCDKKLYMHSKLHA